MKEQTHFVHGIPLHRSGSCNRCGDCCRKWNCPHFEDGEVTTCSVQGKKEEVCRYCSDTEEGVFYREGKNVTHADCHVFPNHAWLRILKMRCGYSFERIDDKNKPLPFMDK